MSDIAVTLGGMSEPEHHHQVSHRLHNYQIQVFHNFNIGNLVIMFI